jgi:hypothetical protein
MMQPPYTPRPTPLEIGFEYQMTDPVIPESGEILSGKSNLVKTI